MDNRLDRDEMNLFSRYHMGASFEKVVQHVVGCLKSDYGIQQLTFIEITRLRHNARQAVSQWARHMRGFQAGEFKRRSAFTDITEEIIWQWLEDSYDIDLPIIIDELNKNRHRISEEFKKWLQVTRENSHQQWSEVTPPVSSPKTADRP